MPMISYRNKSPIKTQRMVFHNEGENRSTFHFKIDLNKNVVGFKRELHEIEGKEKSAEKMKKSVSK